MDVDDGRFDAETTMQKILLNTQMLEDDLLISGGGRGGFAGRSTGTFHLSTFRNSDADLNGISSGRITESLYNNPLQQQ